MPTKKKLGSTKKEKEPKFTNRIRKAIDRTSPEFGGKPKVNKPRIKKLKLNG